MHVVVLGTIEISGRNTLLTSGTIESSSAMAARSLPWLVLLTCLGIGVCTTFTNVSTLSTIATEVGKPSVPYSFRTSSLRTKSPLRTVSSLRTTSPLGTKSPIGTTSSLRTTSPLGTTSSLGTTSPLSDDDEDEDFTGAHSTVVGNRNSTTTTTNLSRQIQIQPDTVLPMTYSETDCFGAFGNDRDMTTQESLEIVLNPNERVNVTAQECPVWEELSKYFRRNNTLVLYSSRLRTNFEGRAFSCLIAVSAPDLNLRTEMECVGLTCCVYLEGQDFADRCFRHDGYGRPRWKTTLFVPYPFQLSLHKDKSSQPFHVHLHITAYQFPNFTDSVWELGCVSRTQGKCEQETQLSRSVIRGLVCVNVIQTHKRFKRTLFIRTKTQSANFRGNRPCQATERHLTNN